MTKKRWFMKMFILVDLSIFLLCAYGVSRVMQLSDRVLFMSAFVFIVLLWHNGLYKDKRNLFDDSDFMSLSRSAILSFLTVAGFLIIFQLPYLQPVSALFISSVPLLTAGRLAGNRFLRAMRCKGRDVRKTIYFGEPDPELLSKLSTPCLGYDLILVTTDKKALRKRLADAHTIFLNMESVDEELLHMMVYSDANWKIISSILNLVIDPVAFDEFRDYPIINIKNRDTWRRYTFLKRAMDIILSAGALAILSPVLILVAIAVKLTSRGPVMFRQERIGKDLKPFMLYKFRTMVEGADRMKDDSRNEVEGIYKLADDPRTTALGRILRRSCLDELPQLFNILKGEMSIVGPRPHLERELRNFNGWRKARFSVKPGLTGLWQVNGRHELNFDKAMLYDIYYIKHASFLLDLSIIFKTLPAIIMTRGRY
jgi:exopolysaccharide biosynthesis polyprenyl glycosylphosphotransferase